MSTATGTEVDAVTTDETAAASAASAEPAAGVRGIQTLSMAKAINLGIADAMRENDRVLLMGEDVGRLGGVFRVTEGLLAEFGEDRVFDSPLAESGIVGTAIGLAMAGFRPIVEMQFDGFVFPAFDQITTQLARQTLRHEGRIGMPVVVRIPYGGHIGSVEHHQESPEAYFAHTPGLRVISPSTPHDAYWMIRAAVESNDPVIYLEPKSRYWPKGPVDLDHAGIETHQSRVVRTGRDVTVVGHGAMLATLQQAADIAAGEGTSIEIVDLRSLSPVDYGPLVESVQRTGRLVVAQEAYGHVSVGSEIAATVAERAFYALEAPVLRVSGFDTPFPPAALETQYLPSPDRVLEAVDRVLAY